MKPTVFIQTNHKQLVGALVSAYSLRRNSRFADADVRVGMWFRSRRERWHASIPLL